ncbi:cysteine-rich receptor-like protein kinase 5 [Gossypium australe]|uniref:Cysteine-rich receptor-like protein kinase 5 n=1 Tax=Gossypium australe TaxID=47621 RepID=A0A5B6VM65_9ROSI|nr:cysteine-rich receptor-like protein kinase 5 [Gossypium australe]
MGWISLKPLHPLQDVKSTFLNGLLEEEIHVDQPQGFAVLGWEAKKTGNETPLIISSYVDDLLMIGRNNELVVGFKE